MSPDQAMQVLGVEAPDLHGCRNDAEARERVEQWKASVVKLAHRGEIRRNHPDRATTATDAQRRNERRKALNRARDIVMALEPARVAQPAAVRHGHVVVVIYDGGGLGGWPEASTTSGDWPWG